MLEYSIGVETEGLTMSRALCAIGWILILSNYVLSNTVQWTLYGWFTIDKWYPVPSSSLCPYTLSAQLSLIISSWYVVWTHKGSNFQMSQPKNQKWISLPVWNSRTQFVLAIVYHSQIWLRSVKTWQNLVIQFNFDSGLLSMKWSNLL
jgi:hypothetical protein